MGGYISPICLLVSKYFVKDCILIYIKTNKKFVYDNVANNVTIKNLR